MFTSGQIQTIKGEKKRGHVESDLFPLYSPFLFLSSLFPLAFHVVTKSSSGTSLGRSYTRANPSNSHGCTRLRGHISSSPVPFGHLNPHKPM